VWGDPFTKAQFLAGCREIEAVARAEGVPVAKDVVDRPDAHHGDALLGPEDARGRRPAAGVGRPAAPSIRLMLKAETAA
jgi:hypothetical protein